LGIETDELHPLEHANILETAVTLEEIIDSNCVGCVFAALAMVYLQEHLPQKAQEVLNMAKNFSERESYCGTAKHLIWGVPRNKCNGSFKPWE
jgi:hypothetical protein